MNFNVLTERKEKVIEYLEDNAIRFRTVGNHQFFINDYKQSIQEVKVKGQGVYLVNVCLTIGIPPVYLVGLIPLILGVFLSSKLSVMLGFLILSTCIFWNPNFHRWAFIKGLRKSGFKGFISKIGCSKSLELVVYESERSFNLV